MSAPLCAGCSSEIVDRFMYNIVGCSWHADCAKCCICQQALTEKCYTKSNRLYCREDYFRRHTFDCSGCHQHIQANDFVRKLNNQKVYHLSCLICSRCGRVMNTGEDVYIVSTNEFNEQLLCYQDYVEVYTLCSQSAPNGVPAAPIQPLSQQDAPTETKQIYQSPSSVMSMCNENGSDVYHQADSFDFISNSSRPSSNAQIVSQQSPKLAADSGSDESDSTVNQAEPPTPSCGPFGAISPHKEKPESNQNKRGPRTTIKTRQLQLLSEAFLSCQKPSKQMREELARETGLSTRVIQVWFQNRRSKERRSQNVDGKQEVVSSGANFVRETHNGRMRQPPPFFSNHSDPNQFMDPQDEK